MAGYIRRYLQDPGLEELLTIEGVVIIDREPARAITGVGSGFVCMVGETEDGPFNTPIEVFSGNDLKSQFGAFGFTYDGVVSCNPCARARKADGAVANEYWNGNLYVASSGKKFRRFAVVRPDTTVGAVTFTRLAYLDGNTEASWNLEPGQVLAVTVDGAPDTATFDAAVATRNGAAGAYPTTFAGGEFLQLVIDQGTAKEIAVTVVFTSADTSHALVVARINAALGYTGASVQAGDVTRIVGRVRGTAGNVIVVAQTLLVGTKVGTSAGTTPGTGDVADIDNVTFAEAKALIEADMAGVTIERNENGAIRIVSDGTVAPGTQSIEVTSLTTTALAFGFPLDEEATPTTVAVAGVIPAGTRVQNAGGDEWVTALSVLVGAADATATVKVRPADDDTTQTGVVPGAITTMPTPIPGLGSWSVTNTFALTAALTDAQIDAAYATAIDATLNANTVAKEVNIILSARQSNAVRNKLRSNAVTAASSGMRGRATVIRPPLGTSRALARGASQPGVGAYREERVFYTYPGAQVQIAAIAARGTAGGNGFTADGIVDVGSDSWLASICSQLPPEENPGQLTNFAVDMLGIERGNADVQALTMADYIAFKAAGICAPRMDEGVAIFQSGVTSVNPALFPNRKNIARIRMSDFIGDSLATAMRPYAKKLATRQRRAQVVGETNGFMASLAPPVAERIDSYLLDAVTGNTPDSLAAGLFRLILKVRTLPSLDVIVYDLEVGEGVVTVTARAA